MLDSSKSRRFSKSRVRLPSSKSQLLMQSRQTLKPPAAVSSRKKLKSAAPTASALRWVSLRVPARSALVRSWEMNQRFKSSTSRARSFCSISGPLGAHPAKHPWHTTRPCSKSVALIGVTRSVCSASLSTKMLRSSVVTLSTRSGSQSNTTGSAMVPAPPLMSMVSKVFHTFSWSIQTV